MVEARKFCIVTMSVSSSLIEINVLVLITNVFQWGTLETTDFWDRSSFSIMEVAKAGLKQILIIHKQISKWSSTWWKSANNSCKRRYQITKTGMIWVSTHFLKTVSTICTCTYSSYLSPRRKMADMKPCMETTWPNQISWFKNLQTICKINKMSQSLQKIESINNLIKISIINKCIISNYFLN